MRSAPDSPRLRAVQLLGRWTRLAQGHVLLGAGCSCGAGLGSVPVAEFEQDILDYLRSKHPGTELRSSGLVGLLRAIASGQPGTESSAPLLGDLEQSLESFERAHRR